MTTWKAKLRYYSGTLGFRLAFLLAVALLPLALVSAIQSAAMLKETRARSEAALLGETMRASDADLLLVQRARGVTTALANMIAPLLDDPVRCSAAMQDLVARSDIYTAAGFVDRSGILTCVSKGQGLDVSGLEAFRQAMADPVPVIRLANEGRISSQPVVVVADPVFDDETLLGFVTVSLPHDRLTVERPPSLDGLPASDFVTFDTEGTILTSNVGTADVSRILPKDRSLKALSLSGEDVVFTAPSEGGENRSFAVIPIVPDLLYAMGSRPVDDQGIWYMRMLPSVTLPLAMWLACLFVAIAAIERLVTRHVRVLRQAMSGFADGKRIIGRMDMATAPVEFQELSDTFSHMTDTILHDEAEMEDMIHQKEVLLREVHHRVKNNLQLIASIMNMQMRQAKSAEAKSLMKGLQERVMSLATIHRGLYQTTGLTDIRADELLVDITRQVVQLAAGPGTQIGIDHAIGEVRLTPDQAVPLSLLLTEALANAVKYAGSTSGRSQIRVSLDREGGTHAVLQVRNTLGPIPATPGTSEGTGLGTQLLTAFAQQVGGRLDTETTEDMYTLRVVFEVRPLNEGEARISGGAAAET
ncbi:sensor histidine kinase [Falsirhodobacter halotolerans]|uniref:sensor histidine kinase n=1 Tax=Falsirhodobacter halotolerans TaxID=1146892 RepID=UPI001FD445BF|nr:sensor histidine kinase [Falsirhodobacter halotolerans]MCJ8140747.1 sensor histidine kinase [Falsirhodobacter halotolerans]